MPKFEVSFDEVNIRDNNRRERVKQIKTATDEDEIKENIKKYADGNKAVGVEIENIQIRKLGEIESKFKKDRWGH